MAKKKRLGAKSLDEKYMGSEPVLAEDYQFIDISKAYNWYNYFADRKTPRKYVNEYVRFMKKGKDVSSAINRVDDVQINRTMSFLCRMASNGVKLKGEQQDYLNENFDSLIALGKAKKKEKEIVKSTTQLVSVQDRVKEKAGELIAEIEEVIDNVAIRRNVNDFGMYDWLTHKQVKPMVANHIAEYYKPMLEEIKQVLDNSDPDLTEGYSWMSKKEQRNYEKLLQGIIDDVADFGTNQRKVRSPRKKQTKSAQQILKNFKYQAEDTSLKIASVDPSKMLESSELWTYNTKYKELSHYVASDRGGLTVKGTTLQNWDPDKSSKRKIRKPEDVLRMILKVGPKTVTKTFDKLTTKATPCNGRINDSTVLLRIIK
jgi:hypothetical protein